MLSGLQAVVSIRLAGVEVDTDASRLSVALRNSGQALRDSEQARVSVLPPPTIFVSIHSKRG